MTIVHGSDNLKDEMCYYVTDGWVVEDTRELG